MPSFADLFDPNESYRYFEHASRHPFQTHRMRFSLINAGWLADCALLAYLPEGQVKDRLTSAGLSGKCFGFGGLGAQGFLARNDQMAIVCFRGTEDLKDVVADARIKLQHKPPHAGEIHSGFHDTLGSIWDGDGIEEELEHIQEGRETPVPVWFTGHSLGAAMATLAADRYGGARALYTYGSPRVGDEEFRRGLGVNAYRIVNNNDGVATVPPGRPLSPYRHVGDLKYLSDDGHLIDDPGRWAAFKAGLTGHLRHILEVAGDVSRGDFNLVPFDQLSDHSPTAYASGLWRIIVR